MKYVGTLIVVKDMERSKEFYRDILGQHVAEDFGANVVMTGGFFLQTASSYTDFIDKDETAISYGGNNAELYFETDDMDGFVEKLNGALIRYVHPLVEHSWGQKAIRFYDPDMHIIEVGENMAHVVKRFIDSGLTVEQTALRMDVSVEYVQNLLNGNKF